MWTPAASESSRIVEAPTYTQLTTEGSLWLRRCSRRAARACQASKCESDTAARITLPRMQSTASVCPSTRVR